MPSPGWAQSPTNHRWRDGGAIGEAKGSESGDALTNAANGAAISPGESGESARRRRFLMQNVSRTQIKKLPQARDRRFGISLLHRCIILPLPPLSSSPPLLLPTRPWRQ